MKRRTPSQLQSKVKRARRHELRSRPKRVAGFAQPTEEPILGIVTHYYPRVRAAVVKLRRTLRMGDLVYIKGHTTDLQQETTSIQLNHRPITQGRRGLSVGLLVKGRVRPNDVVYLLKCAPRNLK